MKDVIEDAIEDKLEARHFPYLSGCAPSKFPSTTTSARYGQWHNRGQGGAATQRNVPRLIAFIIGGITYSELRVCYELTKLNPKWDLVVGSTHLLTPEGFLADLRDLKQ